MTNHNTHRFSLYTSADGVIKLRKTETGTGGKQKTISLGIKNGEPNAEIKAKSILMKHQLGEEDFFTSHITKPKNKRIELSSKDGKPKNDKWIVVYEKCVNWIELHMTQEERDQKLGIVNRSRSNSMKTYRQRFKMFNDRVIEKLGTSATMAELRDISFYEDWVDTLTDQKQSQHTIQGKVMTLWTVFKENRIFETYGINKDDFLIFTKSRRVRKSISKRLSEDEYLSDDDIEDCRNGWRKLKARQTGSEKYEDLFWFLIYSGCRVNIEALQIQVKEIEWDEKRVWLKQAWEDKDMPSDWLSLNEKALAALKSHIVANNIVDPNEFVFGNVDYFNFLTCLKKYIPLWTHPKKKSTPHMCRHTFATLMLSRGASLWLVASLLRHKTLSMIEKHYGHLVKKDQRQFLELL